MHLGAPQLDPNYTGDRCVQVALRGFSEWSLWHQSSPIGVELETCQRCWLDQKFAPHFDPRGYVVAQRIDDGIKYDKAVQTSEELAPILVSLALIIRLHDRFFLFFILPSSVPELQTQRDRRDISFLRKFDSTIGRHARGFAVHRYIKEDPLAGQRARLTNTSDKTARLSKGTGGVYLHRS